MNHSALAKLLSVGLDEDLLRQASQTPDCFLARVSVQHKEHYRVIGENGEMQAVISGKLGYLAEDAPDYPAVGDWVLVDRTDDVDPSGVLYQNLGSFGVDGRVQADRRRSARRPATR